MKETKIIIDNVGKQNIVFDEDKVLENLKLKINNKSADEMFKELGFSKTQYDDGDIFYYQENGIGENWGFEFRFGKYYKNKGEIYPVCHSKDDEPICITIEEFNAIGKKMQELGWI